MPATLIASVYGMNVVLPWQELGGLASFWITMAFMIVASGVTLGFFRYKKWL
jgi:Mg2+ and Co2+ transporter CorA